MELPLQSVLRQDAVLIKVILGNFLPGTDFIQVFSILIWEYCLLLKKNYGFIYGFLFLWYIWLRGLLIHESRVRHLVYLLFFSSIRGTFRTTSQRHWFGTSLLGLDQKYNNSGSMGRCLFTHQRLQPSRFWWLQIWRL